MNSGVSTSHHNIQHSCPKPSQQGHLRNMAGWGMGKGCMAFYPQQRARFLSTSSACGMSKGIYNMHIFLGHLLPSSWYLKTTGLITVWDMPLILAVYCVVFSLSPFILPEQLNLISPCFFFQPGLFIASSVLLLKGSGRQSSRRNNPNLGNVYSLF